METSLTTQQQNHKSSLFDDGYPPYMGIFLPAGIPRCIMDGKLNQGSSKLEGFIGPKVSGNIQRRRGGWNKDWIGIGRNK